MSAPKDKKIISKQLVSPIVQPVSQAMPLWVVSPNCNVPVNCPPGLEYLLHINQIFVRQKVDLMELITGFEINNQYEIQNNMGHNIYLASETTDDCTRNFCGSDREFEIRFFDYSRREVLRLYRPLRCNNHCCCCFCCCFCCLQYIEVEAPAGHLIGRVVQDWSFLRPAFRIKSPNGKTIFRILGPICMCGFYGQDIQFNILSGDRPKIVGQITKHWSGMLREHYTNADTYGVVFPMDLDVGLKACLIAAALLIDFMFFEHKPNTEEDRRRRRGGFHSSSDD